MKNIILFGIQGSGKGTQAQILAEKYGYRLFETGGQLREIMKQNNELGREVKVVISRGDLVSNAIVMRIVAHFLDSISPDQKVLFDGLPRSMEQKKTFDALLEKEGREVTGIFLDIDRKEAIQRMMDRGREDDARDVIERRLENYTRETRPVIDEYEREKKMKRINGLRSIDEVSADIASFL